ELLALQRTEHLGHRLDARLHVEELPHFLVIQDQQAHANTSVRVAASAGSSSRPSASRTGSTWSGRVGPTTTAVIPSSDRSQASASPAIETSRSRASASSRSSASKTRPVSNSR